MCPVDNSTATPRATGCLALSLALLAAAVSVRSCESAPSPRCGREATAVSNPGRVRSRLGRAARTVVCIPTDVGSGHLRQQRVRGSPRRQHIVRDIDREDVAPVSRKRGLVVERSCRCRVLAGPDDARPVADHPPRTGDRRSPGGHRASDRTQQRWRGSLAKRRDRANVVRRPVGNGANGSVTATRRRPFGPPIHWISRQRSHEASPFTLLQTCLYTRRAGS